ncbi:MAG: biotin/lipoyl-containing protein, partial [Actinocatenispora sp.]
MSRVKQFPLPDLGEGLTEGEILKWFVAPGDEVTLNQPIVEVETAKAAVEIPSPYAGVITEIHHKEGETVDVGSPIVSFDTDPSAGPLPAGGTESATAGAAKEPEESTAVLVGRGAKEASTKRRARRPATTAAPTASVVSPPPP